MPYIMAAMKTMTLFLLLLSLILSSCSDDGSVVDPDLCQGVACSGHGECVVGAAGAACECDTDYHAEGLSCVEDGTTGPCYQVDCSGHGVCVDVNGAPACVCDEGFHDVELSCIEDSVDSCEGVTCSGHGRCVEHGGVAECDCDEGYEAEGLECLETLCACRDRG